MSREMYVEGCGQLIRSTAGKGHLITQDKLQIECAFELCQFSNDEIRTLCIPSEAGIEVGMKSEMGFAPGYVMTFKGWTHNGEFFEVFHGGTVGPFDEDEYDPDDPDEYRNLKEGITLSVSSGVLRATSHGEPRTLIAQLANLECYWMQDVPVYINRKNVLVVPPIEFIINSKPVRMRPAGTLLQYESAIKRLKRLNTVEMTSCLEIPISRMDELPDIGACIEAICSILSLLTGTEIKELSYDVFSKTGELIQSSFGHAGVKKVSGFNPHGWVQQSEWRNIIQAGVPMLAQAIYDWNVLTLIRHFIGSKVDGDSLEERGLKLAVCMEIVRAKFLAQKGREYIISADTYQNSFKKIRKGLKNVLIDALPQIENEDLEMMLNHAQGLNYYPFRRALKEMCSEVNLYSGDQQAISEDVSTFIEIRNHLVHQGCFVDRLQGPSHPLLHTDFYQLIFMESFVLKFILAILGHASTPMRVPKSAVHPSQLLQ